jgi:low affinity Fe/Cu permease
MNEAFRRFSVAAAAVVGSSWSFIVAVLLVVVWGFTGPWFHYSDTWQLLINTGTTVVTFLMVFLIQNTQNRDAKAMHLKIDELLRAVKGARTGLVNLETLSDAELAVFQKEFERLAKREPTAVLSEELVAAAADAGIRSGAEAVVTSIQEASANKQKAKERPNKRTDR